MNDNKMESIDQIEKITEDKFMLENDGVKISSIKTNIESGMYEGFLVKYNGKEKTFNWESIDFPSFTPKVTIFDHRQYLLITTVSGKGTGLYLEEAHVLETESLNDIFIENPNEYIEKHITSKIQKDGQVIVFLDGKEIGRDNLMEGISEENLFDSVGFGNIIKYEIKKDKPYVEVGSLVTPGAIFCSLGFTYEQNKNGSFLIKDVTYIAPIYD